MFNTPVHTPGSKLTEQQLFATNVAMILLTSLVVAFRAIVQIIRRKRLEPPDYFIYSAFVFHLTLSILGIFITPLMYSMSDVESGKRPPYPQLAADAAFTAKLIFTGQICFWICLWGVKFSLLALYKNLMEGVPGIYNKAWWGIVGFCVLSFAGILAANARMCNDMHAFFTTGECSSPDDVWGTLFCMYFAYAADVLTDFLIMFLPLRLVWNLQMPPLQKISICLIFSTGLLCIAFATIRVANIGMGGGNHLDPKRTALWSILETAVAIIVGCCPAFVALARERKNMSTRASDTQRYTRRSGNRSIRYDAEKGIKLRSLMSSVSRVTLSGSKPLWEHKNDSREEFANDKSQAIAAHISDPDDAQSGISQASSRI